MPRKKTTPKPSSSAPIAKRGTDSASAFKGIDEIIKLARTATLDIIIDEVKNIPDRYAEEYLSEMRLRAPAQKTDLLARWKIGTAFAKFYKTDRCAYSYLGHVVARSVDPKEWKPIIALLHAEGALPDKAIRDILDFDPSLFEVDL